MLRSIRSLAAIAAIAVPAALSAQSVPSPTGVALPAAKKQVLSVQPITAMFTVYSAEFERALSQSVTLGVGGTFLGADDEEEGGDASLSYTSTDVKLRYYPGASPFQGFSFGVQGGYTRVAGRLTDDASGESVKGSVGGPSFGVALDYNWLLSASRTFYVGLGVGAKAAFIDDDKLDGDVTARYPTARVSIGYAF